MRSNGSIAHCLVFAGVGVGLFGCPASDPAGGGGASVGSGGANRTGGTSGSGGGVSSGGTTGSGGGVSSGGTTGSGGGVSSGGITGSGGTIGIGGSASGGGFANTGGTTGTGGRGGTGGAPAPGGSGGGVGTGGTAGPCTAPGLILCDDFESRTTGVKPTGAPWLTTNCSATNFVLKVDTTTATSGTKSLASQGVPYGECMLHADLGATPPTDFWVRSRVRFAAGDATQFMAHELVAYDLNPTMNTDDPGIRVGFRGDNSCSAAPFDGRGVEVNITGGQEITGCTGFKLQADKWYCLELHVVRNASNATTATLLIDGASQMYNIHGTAADMVVNTNPAIWRYLRVGARPYSSAYPWPIYIDDLAVGTQKIGCN